ncbi:MAG: AAA family ATPase, partial [Armatimonadota bacterium]
RALTTIRTAILSWRVYHFHDTTPAAPVKQRVYLGDNLALRGDAGNLAAILYRMRDEYPSHYAQVVERIREAAPFFGDFVLEPLPADRLLLRWRERGHDVVFSPDALSDGTLRYICLMTLLHQPPDWMPATILIDEPELGLHPYAIKLLAGSLRMASAHAQLLVATQSPLLLDNFAPEEVLVAERGEAGTTIRRLDAEALQHWLEDYSMGEIWEKNLIGGRPPR